MKVAAVAFVYMHIKTARRWINEKKKPEKIQNYSQMKFQRKAKFHGQEYYKWQIMMNWFTN
jgi:hypothetical protein